MLIAVGGLVGWKQWGAYQEKQGIAAAEKYTQTLDALSRADRDAATKIAQELKSDYSRTPYGDMAALAIARFHVDEGKLPEAARYLEGVMNDARDEELRLVARLRLARVQRAAGELDKALATLKPGEASQLAPAYAEARGDILLDKGDRAGALAAYQAANATKEADLVDRELLGLKIADLGGEPVAKQADTAAAPNAAAPAAGAP